MTNPVSNIYLAFRSTDFWVFPDALDFDEENERLVISIIHSEAKLAYRCEAKLAYRCSADAEECAARFGYVRGGYAWDIFVAEYRKLEAGKE